MNTEQVKQIVETIKTLNLNLNDATTQKLADSVVPLVKWYMFIDLAKSFIAGVAIVLAVWILMRGIISIIKLYDN